MREMTEGETETKKVHFPMIQSQFLGEFTAKFNYYSLQYRHHSVMRAAPVEKQHCGQGTVYYVEFKVINLTCVGVILGLI